MAIAAPRPADTTPAAPAARTRVAIAGATGYAGQELVRLLARHPAVTLTAAMSSAATSTPRPLPALARIWDGEVVAARRRSAGRRRRHRLPGAARGGVGRDRHGAARSAAGASSISPAPSGFATTPIASAGIRRRPRCRRASSTACRNGTPTRFAARSSSRARAATRRPRCWRCEPLADAGLLEGAVVVDAKSGISGAGKTPSDRTHFCENHGSVAAYGIFSHRHTAEIEQELGASGDVRAAPRAARPRHPRDDLRLAAPRDDRGAGGRGAADARTRPRRSCG